MGLLTSQSEGISVQLQDNIATIRLENPELRNRISASNITFLRQVLAAIADDTAIRCLVLTGDGDCFCAGFDLNALASVAEEMDTHLDSSASKQDSPASIDADVLAFEALTNELENLRCPTICALNGSAYGGGIDLALACDFRIGIQGTKIMLPAANIGLHYPPSGIQRFVQRLGPTVAKRLLLLADVIEADELLAVGFLSELVEKSSLPEHCQQLASQIASKAPLAVEAMKSAINEFSSTQTDQSTITERYRNCLQSEDFLCGIQAIQKRQQPKFSRR